MTNDDDQRITQFFATGHLKPELRPVVDRFKELADWIVAELPWNHERTMALRKLLESKDAAIRTVNAQAYAEIDRAV